MAPLICMFGLQGANYETSEGSLEKHSVLPEGQRNQAAAFCRSNTAQAKRNSYFWPGSGMLKQDKPLSFVLILWGGTWHFCFKHSTFSCLEKASMFTQIFLYCTACLRHVGPHAAQWLSSSQPPTSASVTFCRLLYALFFFPFFLNICRNIHFEAGAESFRSLGSSFVS